MMRVLEISGLVSLRKYFARAARAAAMGAGGAAVIAFNPEVRATRRGARLRRRR